MQDCCRIRGWFSIIVGQASRLSAGERLPLSDRGQAGRLPYVVLTILFFVSFSPPSVADDLEDAQALFNAGKYDECIKTAAAEVEDRGWRESWWTLKISAELTTGRYADALATLERASERFSFSLRLHLLANTIYLFNGQPEQAEKMLVDAEDMVRRQSWRYSDSASRVVLGRLFLRRGADAKQVLETFFDRAKRDRPEYVDSYQAIGQLALDKHDYALAAEAFRDAVKLSPDDPETHFGLAQASATGDPERAGQAMARVLELNPNHPGCLLMMVDKLIDAEQYQGADELLKRVLAVNASHPIGCAYRAVLAHLDGNPGGEKSWRDKALAHWSTNPEVDYTIGRKLSQKYRFAEGAACQRRALAFDVSYLPARMQLGQDLLRLGDEAEGWRLAHEVYQQDGYNVAAYNLVTLQETLDKYTTLEADGLLLRMDAFEAQVYGRSALELLGRARRELCAKYEVTLDEPVVVEVFADHKDFAIRTFGMPGGAGFLGVCFGNVVTANSPASQGANPANWQAVLWHEFCHTVTLAKTKNKMPRWLSEGISVYEEKQENGSWGQSITALYRQMILDGRLVPVSALSGAFLDPPSPVDLQFAYYESSLVVEYLVETYGLKTLRNILDDLSSGEPINAVLARHTVPMDELDEAFARFALARAEQLAPEADWQKPELAPNSGVPEIVEWNREHPNSVAGLELLARRLIEQQRWQEAKPPLQRLLDIFPKNVEAENAYLLLALVYRNLGESMAEQAVLEKLAALDADAIEANLRLMQIYEEFDEWDALAEAAERLLAVNPLIAVPHRARARAAEALDDPDRAAGSYRALLAMSPVDPAELHYRLATVLYRQGDTAQARRQVLKSLEEAPRFRAAHRLLLEIVDRESADDNAAGETKP